MDSNIVSCSGSSAGFFSDLLGKLGTGRSKTEQSISVRSASLPWSYDDDELLASMAESGSSVLDIQQSLSVERTIVSIRTRASKLGIALKSCDYYWSEREDNLLRWCTSEGFTVEQTALKVGRPVSGVKRRARILKLSFREKITPKQQEFILKNYPLYGAGYVCKSLSISRGQLNYFIATRHPNLKHKKAKSINPAIPRNLLPYHMAQRVAFLERDCPLSVNKIQDSVVIFYDTKGMGTPMLAMHLDDLVTEIKKHLGVEYV